MTFVHHCLMKLLDTVDAVEVMMTLVIVKRGKQVKSALNGTMNMGQPRSMVSMVVWSTPMQLKLAMVQTCQLEENQREKWRNGGKKARKSRKGDFHDRKEAQSECRLC